MTEDMPEPDDDRLLCALGRVEPPDPAVLEAAREALWSVVAGEMLATDPSGGRKTRAAGTARPQDESRHHRAEGS